MKPSAEQVREWAEKAGARFDPHWGISYNVGTATFERFAELAAQWGAAQEREACAKGCNMNLIPTQEQVSEWIRTTQLEPHGEGWSREQRFAELVAQWGAAQEREACAKMCEQTPKIDAYAAGVAVQDACATAIRNRSKS